MLVFLKTINYRNSMKFIQLKVTSLIRKNTEVFLLILLLIVSTLIIQVYNSQNKKVDNEYIKILRNTYFKKTINHIFFNLTPRYEQIDYSVKSGQTLKDILKEFSVKDEEIKKIFAIIVIIFISCENSKVNSENIFRYNEYSNISSLDPAFSSTLRNIWPTHQIFNGLVRMDKNLNILPDIAEDWTISNDKKVYSFKIKFN